MMTTPVVQLTDVSRTFAGTPPVRALRHVSLVIEPGTYLAVVGPSGSGKSTFLHVVGMLEQPSEGTYLFEGSDVATLADEERAGIRGSRIGFVFQDFHLIRHRTVLENVMLGLLYNRFPRRLRRVAATEAVARVGLSNRIDAMPDTLSGGERQRVAIARAIAASPSLLLADEPTGNLDTETTESLLRVFDALNAEGLTLVVVTHDAQVSAHASRQVELIDGLLGERRPIEALP
jgi:putative ABC transport system ATP-binding protein